MDNLVNKIQLYCDANGKIANFNSEGGNVLIQDDMIDNVSNPYISKQAKIVSVSELPLQY